MKAVSIKEPGGPEVLEWTDVEDPTPAPGEVIIDVVATALNRADVMQRMGLYPVPPGTSPYPGLEVRPHRRPGRKRIRLAGGR